MTRCLQVCTSWWPLKLIRYTTHAETALRERHLEKQWIELTLAVPEWRSTDPRDPSVERYFRTLPERGNRTLRVACGETPAEIRILSAYLDRGEKAEMTLKVEYDPEADAAYIRFSSEPIEESEEVSAGIVLDFDAEGHIVGMEVMRARDQLPPAMLVQAA